MFFQQAGDAQHLCPIPQALCQSQRLALGRNLAPFLGAELIQCGLGRHKIACIERQAQLCHQAGHMPVAIIFAGTCAPLGDARFIMQCMGRLEADERRQLYCGASPSGRICRPAGADFFRAFDGVTITAFPKQAQRFGHRAFIALAGAPGTEFADDARHVRGDGNRAQ